MFPAPLGQKLVPAPIKLSQLLQRNSHSKGGKDSTVKSFINKSAASLLTSRASRRAPTCRVDVKEDDKKKCPGECCPEEMAKQQSISDRGSIWYNPRCCKPTQPCSIEEMYYEPQGNIKDRSNQMWLELVPEVRPAQAPCPVQAPCADKAHAACGTQPKTEKEACTSEKQKKQADSNLASSFKTACASNQEQEVPKSASSMGHFFRKPQDFGAGSGQKNKRAIAGGTKSKKLEETNQENLLWEQVRDDLKNIKKIRAEGKAGLMKRLERNEKLKAKEDSAAYKNAWQLVEKDVKILKVIDKESKTMPGSRKQKSSSNNAKLQKELKQKELKQKEVLHESPDILDAIAIKIENKDFPVNEKNTQLLQQKNILPKRNSEEAQENADEEQLNMEYKTEHLRERRRKLRCKARLARFLDFEPAHVKEAETKHVSNKVSKNAYVDSEQLQALKEGQRAADKSDASQGTLSEDLVKRAEHEDNSLVKKEDDIVVKHFQPSADEVTEQMQAEMLNESAMVTLQAEVNVPELTNLVANEFQTLAAGHGAADERTTKPNTMPESLSKQEKDEVYNLVKKEVAIVEEHLKSCAGKAREQMQAATVTLQAEVNIPELTNLVANELQTLKEAQRSIGGSDATADKHMRTKMRSSESNETVSRDKHVQKEESAMEKWQKISLTRWELLGEEFDKDRAQLEVVNLENFSRFVEIKDEANKPSGNKTSSRLLNIKRDLERSTKSSHFSNTMDTTEVNASSLTEAQNNIEKDTDASRQVLEQVAPIESGEYVLKTVKGSTKPKRLSAGTLKELPEALLPPMTCTEYSSLSEDDIDVEGEQQVTDIGSITKTSDGYFEDNEPNNTYYRTVVVLKAVAKKTYALPKDEGVLDNAEDEVVYVTLQDELDSQNNFAEHESFAIYEPNIDNEDANSAVEENYLFNKQYEDSVLCGQEGALELETLMNLYKQGTLTEPAATSNDANTKTMLHAATEAEIEMIPHNTQADKASLDESTAISTNYDQFQAEVLAQASTVLAQQENSEPLHIAADVQGNTQAQDEMTSLDLDLHLETPKVEELQAQSNFEKETAMPEQNNAAQNVEADQQEDTTMATDDTNNYMQLTNHIYRVSPADRLELKDTLTKMQENPKHDKPNKKE